MEPNSPPTAQPPHAPLPPYPPPAALPPYGPPGGYPPQPAYPPYLPYSQAAGPGMYGAPVTSAGRGQAVTGVALGFVGLLFGFLLLPLAGSLAAVVLGHTALGTIRRTDQYRQGEELAIVAFIVGYVGLFIWLLVFFGESLLRLGR